MVQKIFHGKLPVVLLALAACETKDPDADWDTGSGYSGSSGTSWDSSPTFNIAWTDDGTTLEASVSNGHEDGYFLGLAESGSGGLGWYGEDCVSDDAICHDLGRDDYVSLSSAHPDAGGAGIDAVVAGSTTLFHVGLWSGVTYVFFSNAGDTGYQTIANVGGDDPSYYQ